MTITHRLRSALGLALASCLLLAVPSCAGESAEPGPVGGATLSLDYSCSSGGFTNIQFAKLHVEYVGTSHVEDVVAVAYMHDSTTGLYCPGPGNLDLLPVYLPYGEVAITAEFYGLPSQCAGGLGTSIVKQFEATRLCNINESVETGCRFDVVPPALACVDL